MTLRKRVPKGLTDRQKRFVSEYLLDLNATRAGERAGYSRKTANEQGSRLLANVSVQAAIQSGMDRRAGKLEITAEKVLQEIARMAFFDPRKLFESDGSPKQIHQLDDDTAAGVAGLEVAELFEGAGEQKHAYGLIKKIKLADKRANLELLGKHLQLFTEKVEHEHKGGIVLLHSIGRPIRD